MIKKVLKVSALLFLLLLVITIGALSWFIGTERGFQHSLGLAKKFAPGSLQWQEASGKLIGPFQVQGLHYSQDEGIDARVAKLAFDWRPGALIDAELAIDQLHLDNLEIRLAESEEPSEASSTDVQIPDVALPVAIKLNDIVVNDASIYPAGEDTATIINRVALKASVDESNMQIQELDVKAPQAEMSLKGNLTTLDDYPMDLAINWQADIGQPSDLQGEGTIVGSLAELQVNHQVAGFAKADISATIRDITDSISWDASINGSVAEPGSLSPQLTGTPQITLETSGALDAFQALATLEIDTTETGPVTTDVNISGSTEVLVIDSLLVKLIENNARFSANGQVTLATQQVDLKGQWQGLGWPVSGESQFTSDIGSFDVSGSLDNFAANLNAQVDGESIPQGQWIASLNGSATNLDSFTVRGQTLDGNVSATGTANWESVPTWDVQLNTQGINPGKQWGEFPGSIDMDISSKGQIGEDGPSLSADIIQLSGRLRDQALSGSGSVRMEGETVNIDDIDLALGDNKLNANGQLDNQINLDFELDSPDLQALLPELTGAVSLAGKVSGDKAAPMIKAQGNANNIVFAENTVGTLVLEIDGGLAETARSTISVDAADISAGGQRISDVKLQFQGSQPEHLLELSANTDQGDFATQLEGSFQNSTWKGRLQSLSLDNTPAGNWQLREPTPITANAEKADASNLCLDNRDKLGSLCATGNWLAEGESGATMNITGLAPELIADYLPPDFVVETRLDGEARAVLGADGDLNADARLAFEPGKLTISTESSPVEIGLEQTNIDASWRDNDATLNLVTALTDYGDISLQGSVSDLAAEGRLAGSLNADFSDLTLISAFAPQVQQVSGTLKSNLSITGTLKSPKIEGELALREFGAEIPETAMLIEDTQLVVTGNADGTLLITGESRSGEGRLDINGRFNPGTRALDIDLQGENYEVANTNLMQAVISPALSIDMDDDGMRVNGEVSIPSAYINANGGSDGIKTVSSSSDVVYVSEEGEQAETPPSLLNLDVRVVLGDSVEVEAGDFRGRLEGDLTIEQTPELAPRGTGTINVVNGDYVIYGQQLDMERGRILFSGGPVDNPSLDMQVARTVQEYDVVAGARIQGTAQSPRLELYSEPSMPDASILSFILLGQPPGAMGASYTLGKYLTPDLYVSYGIGLFDAINTFNMRYRLTDKLAVEAESGSGSSADLIYTIEK